MTTVHFHTFGCKANQYDSELLRTKMESGGGKTTLDFAEADICVVNSCSVTAVAAGPATAARNVGASTL